MRRRLGVLLFVLVVEGCAATATSDGAAPKPPLPLGELLLVGFGGTQVEGNEEVRELVCDVKVGGLILFERDARTGGARNITGRSMTFSSACTHAYGRFARTAGPALGSTSPSVPSSSPCS